MDRDSLMFLIRALYKNGYNEIDMKFNNPFVTHIRLNKNLKTIEVISKEISRLPGMDIFSHKENYCIIKNITEDSPKALDNMIRRVFLLILETMEDLYEGFKNKDDGLLESIQIKHDNITKFYTYSQRILNKFSHEDIKNNDVLYHILEVLDEIEDVIKFTARLLLKYNIKSSKDSSEIIKKIINCFEIYYRVFYKFNLKDTFEINKIRYEIKNSLNNPKGEISKKELVILIQMEQIVDKILNLTTSTMSLNY